MINVRSLCVFYYIAHLTFSIFCFEKRTTCPVSLYCSRVIFCLFLCNVVKHINDDNNDDDS